MSVSASEAHHLKKAPHVEGVLPVFLHRWSPRAFADKDVSAKDLETIFEAVRWTASSFNEQPWRFLMGRRGSETYEKILNALVPFNKQWAGKAPVLILGVTKMHSARNGELNRAALFDLGAASFALALQASALGLFTHQMAGVDTQAVRMAFEIPADFEIGSVIALGHQGDPESLPMDQMKQQETAPRQRRRLSEFVWAEWEKAARV